MEKKMKKVNYSKRCFENYLSLEEELQLTIKEDLRIKSEIERILLMTIINSYKDSFIAAVSEGDGAIEASFDRVYYQKEIKYRRKKYIADFLFELGKYKVIVELDGYEWHKHTFTKDRQRDRAFRRAGIDIIRYSGSEIMKDPISCAVDLFQYIESHWEFEHFLTGD